MVALLISTSFPGVGWYTTSVIFPFGADLEITIVAGIVKLDLYFFAHSSLEDFFCHVITAKKLVYIHLSEKVCFGLQPSLKG